MFSLCYTLTLYHTCLLLGASPSYYLFMCLRELHCLFWVYTLLYYGKQELISLIRYLRKVITESSVYLWFSGVEFGNFRNVRASNTQIWHAYCYRCSFGKEYFFFCFFFFFFILEVSFVWLFMGCINLLCSFIPFYLWHG